jgi:hypothetical protein
MAAFYFSRVIEPGVSFHAGRSMLFVHFGNVVPSVPAIYRERGSFGFLPSIPDRKIEERE